MTYYLICVQSYNYLNKIRVKKKLFLIATCWRQYTVRITIVWNVYRCILSNVSVYFTFLCKHTTHYYTTWSYHTLLAVLMVLISICYKYLNMLACYYNIHSHRNHTTCSELHRGKNDHRPPLRRVDLLLHSFFEK